MLPRILSALLLASPLLFGGACKPGKLKPDYNDTECNVGNLLFKFDKQESAMATSTSVTPVASGLQFSIMADLSSAEPQAEKPDAVEPLAIKVSLAITFKVQATVGTITQVTLAGDLGATKPPALVSFVAKVGAKNNEVRMQLNDFSSMTDVFTMPVANKTYLPMVNDVEAHTGKPAKEVPDTAVPDVTAPDAAAPVTLTFTDTFMLGK